MQRIQTLDSASNFQIESDVSPQLKQQEETKREEEK